MICLKKYVFFFFSFFASSFVHGEISIINVTNTDMGNCAGKIEIIASGTAGPFTVNLEGVENAQTVSNVDGGYTFEGLCGGEYLITVTNFVGCSIELSQSITECAISIEEEIVGPTCIGSNGAYIGVEFDNIQGPWVYQWFNVTDPNNPVEIPGQAENTRTRITHAPAGLYTLIVTDVAGCTIERNFSTFTEEYQIPYISRLTMDILSISGEVQYENFYVGEWSISGDGCVYFDSEIMSGISTEFLNYAGYRLTAETNNSMLNMGVELGNTFIMTPVPGSDNKQWTYTLPGNSSGGPFSQQLQNEGYFSFNPVFGGKDINENELLDLKSYDESLSSCVDVPLFTTSCVWEPTEYNIGEDDVHEITYYPCFFYTETPIIEANPWGISPEPGVTVYEISVSNYASEDYYFDWTLPDGSTSANPAIQVGDNEPGLYCVDIYSSEICYRSECYYFAPMPMSGEFQTNYNCDSRKVEVCYEVSNGSGIYEYEWFNESTGVELGNNNCVEGEFAGQTICVKYTDVSTGLTLTDCFEVPDASQSFEVIVNTSPPCPTDSGNGEICLEITGGVPPYDVLWSGTPYPVTGLCVNLPYGVYDANIFDACGNRELVRVRFKRVEPELKQLLFIKPNINCSNGSLVFDVENITPPLNIGVSQGILSNLNNFYLITDLQPGELNIYIEDDCGVILDQTIEIIDNGEEDDWYEQVGIASTSTPYQAGSGTVTVNFAGATGAPFTILFESPGQAPQSVFDFGTSYTFESLGPGVYTATVSNNDGCTDHVLSVIVCEDMTVFPTLNHPLGCETNDGSIYLPLNGSGPFGGVGVIDYYWTFEGSILTDLTELGMGTYTIHMTDENGCNSSKEFELIPELTPSIVIDEVTDECEGMSNGSIELFISPNITSTAFFENLTTGEVYYLQTDETGYVILEGLKGGNYEVNIYNGSGCSTNKVFEIGIRESTGYFTLEEVIVEKSCPFIEESSLYNNNGSISIILSGGNPPYKVKWEHNSSTSGESHTINNLPPGEYCIDEITDDCGRNLFISTLCYTVGTYPEINISSQSLVDCPGDSKIDITVSGGEGSASNFDIDWNTGTQDSNGDLVNLYEGTYTVTVTDEVGCAQQKSIFVDDIDPPNPNFSVEVGTACDGFNIGKISFNASGGKPFTSGPAYLVRWTHNNSTETTINNLPPGDYTLQIEDQCGVFEYTATIQYGSLFYNEPIGGTCYTGTSCGGFIVQVDNYIPPQNFTVNPNSCELTIECPNSIETITTFIHSSENSSEEFLVDSNIEVDDHSNPTEVDAVCDCEKKTTCTVSGVYNDAYQLLDPCTGAVITNYSNNVIYNNITGSVSQGHQLSGWINCFTNPDDCEASSISCANNQNHKLLQRLCGDKVSCETCTSDALTGDSINSLISAVPNPFSDQLNVTYSNSTSDNILNIEFINTLGEVIRTSVSQITSGINRIQISSGSTLDDGIYYLRCSTNNNPPEVVKILKMSSR